jgi:hypothetical protein
VSNDLKGGSNKKIIFYPPKLKMATRKKTFRKRKRTTRHRLKRKRVFRKKRKVAYKKGKGGRTIAPRKYHGVLSRRLDKDRMIFEQTFMGVMNWTPAQVLGVGGALGDHTDGFIITMNSLVNAFGLGGGIGSTNGGVPIVNPSPLSLSQFVNNAASGSSNVPDGLTQAMNRYTYLMVVGGVFTIEISQDTPGTGSVMGSTKIGVCGFPSSLSLLNVGSPANGHYLYNTLTSGGASNEGSFANLANEPNAITRTLTPFAGSRTMTKIKYPFSIAKFARPGYMANSLFYQLTPTAGGNPNFVSAAPFILVQYLSDGVQPMTYRVNMKMKWYAMGFDRKQEILVT